MTKKGKPEAEKQSDALAPNATVLMRELVYNAQQIEADHGDLRLSRAI